jgi:epsilon-lactone hydrolase
MPSLGLQFARLVVRFGRDPERSPEELRAHVAQRPYPSPAQATWRARRIVTITESSHRDRPVFELIPKASAKVGRRVIYFHGGGFVNPLHWGHWDICASLAKVLDAQVTLPIYPLCPEHTIDECHQHLSTLYAEVAQNAEAEELILCGDSAGANLALTVTLQALGSGLPLPARLILFCPWVDLSMSNPEISRYQLKDPMLTRSTVEEWGRWWAGERGTTHPEASPLYADLSGLPPVDLFLGADDMLTPDALLLAEALERAGIEVTQRVTTGAFHDFMAVSFIRETKAVFRAISERARGGT